MDQKEKLGIDFLKKMQSGVEPPIAPGETALEAIQRMEKERLSRMGVNSTPQQPTPPPQQPPVQEVVFVEGYKLPRNFFTAIALCIMKLDDPELNKIMESFGFEMKDLNGKPVLLKKRRVTRRR